MSSEDFFAPLTQEEENWLKKWESNNQKDYNTGFSNAFKKRMNRLFREQLGGNYALHPEVDNAFERIRSQIIRKILVIKERLYTKNQPR